MKKLFILLISLIFLFSATAHADMGKKSCYLDGGSKFENKMDDGALSDHDKEMMEMHHHHMDKKPMMKKMEKHGDIIERGYHPNDNNFYDDYL